MLALVVAQQNSVLQIHECPGNVTLFVLTSVLGNICVEGWMNSAVERSAIYRLIKVDGDEIH